MKKGIWLSLITVLLLGFSITIWARSTRTISSVSLQECSYRTVDYKVVTQITGVIKENKLDVRGFKEEGESRVLLLALEVTRPSSQQFEIDNTELSLAYHLPGYPNDYKGRCFGLRITETKPDLDSDLIVAVPVQIGDHVGINWPSEKPNRFHLTAALECAKGVKGELWISTPSGIVINP